MLKRFLKDSAVYGLTGFLARAVGLLLLPLYTRVLSPTEYGVVDLVQVARSFVAVTIALEIVQGLVRLLPEAPEEVEKGALASTALWFTVAMYAVFSVAAFVFAAPLAGVLLDSAARAAEVRVGTLFIATGGVFSLLQELLRFELKPRWYTAGTLGSVAATAAVTVALLLFTPLRVNAVLLGLTAGNVVGIAVSAWGARGRISATFTPARCREMLGFSIPLVASSAAVMVSMFVDRLAIRSMMTVADVGVYGVAARFASAVSVAMGVVQMALIPLIYNQHASPETPREVARIFRLLAVLICPGLLLSGVFAPELIRLVATTRYLGAAPLVAPLALSIVLSQMWVFAPGLGIAKRTRMIALLNAGGAALNLALLLVLVPAWGIMGAAVSTLLASSFTAAGYVLLGRAHYPVPHRWARIGAATAVAAAGVAASWAAWGGVPADAASAWAGKAALGVAATLVMVVILLEPAELRAPGRLAARRRVARSEARA